MAQRRSGSRGRDGRAAGSSARRRVEDRRTPRRPDGRAGDVRRRTPRPDPRDDALGPDVTDIPTDDAAVDPSDAAPTRAGEREIRERSRPVVAARSRVPASISGLTVGGLSPKKAVLLALVISAVALTLAVPLRTYFAQRSEAEQLRSANASISREVGELQQKVAEQDDPAYVEEQARQRLLMVRPGEIPLAMQFPTPPEKSDDQKRAERQASNPWYTNLLDAVSTPTAR
ncbi:FtsB family cell division protein [Williamsia deligens]|uniref:Septum formation initiator family protein n=1 Tax=Williamsia deligens TaxID=321325 RepID=A0ABW3GD88_9NOCA|nr:septum formation initiator family protein [Williamsia deligens]MCP2192453.1 Cell division protein FtsB [Williamsia deligens]